MSVRLCLLLVCCLTGVAAADAPVDGWRVIQLDDSVGATLYRQIEWDGVNAIEARADNSMSLLARTVSVDLEKTPVLCWLWRIDAVVADADMGTKAGDDYAARVYIALDLPRSAMSWGTRAKLAMARALRGDDIPDAAVNYVWDNRQPVGHTQNNAYTDRARMVVLQSGNEKAGNWVMQRRHIANDIERFFSREPTGVQYLALASDTDNTGGLARAGFARFHWVAESEPCRAP
ncbi:MAG: DUF3047 domain-containing protein [Pseudomonadota bacterium]